MSARACDIYIYTARKRDGGREKGGGGWGRERARESESEHERARERKRARESERERERAKSGARPSFADPRKPQDANVLNRVAHLSTYLHTCAVLYLYI